MSFLSIELKFKFQKVLSSVFGLGLLALINMGTSYQAFAFECNQSVPELPSRNIRVYKDSQYGFQFEMPANYRVMRLSGGDNYSIGIFDPNGYEEMVCIIKNRVGTEPENFPSSITVTLESNQSFFENQQRSLSDGYITNPVEKNGRLIYMSSGTEYEPYIYISQGYKNRFVVTFSAAIGTGNTIIMGDILKQVMNSFQ